MPTAGKDYAPEKDKKGNELKPGDKVSFKRHPKGTGRGVVIISKRSQTQHNGKWLPALSIDSDGTTYPLNSKGVLKLKESIREKMEGILESLEEAKPKKRYTILVYDTESGWDDGGETDEDLKTLKRTLKTNQYTSAIMVMDNSKGGKVVYKVGKERGRYESTELDEGKPNYKGAAEKLMKKYSGKSKEHFMMRAYLRAILSGNSAQATHTRGLMPKNMSDKIKNELIDLAGK